ncbi:hypothetical protein V5O48_004263 [Marasmius crinis-equi]|uniref:HMG box domain-containing protein n=1 Tax=Marasmius crinis-equi TaxID=585013 RepID=A0ABR3FQW4_9AGAR
MSDTSVFAVQPTDAFSSPLSSSSDWSRSHTPEISPIHENEGLNILSLDSIRVAKAFRSEGKPATPDLLQLPSLLTFSAASSSSPEPDHSHEHEHEHEEQPRRIPRPPNAFMLYRSDWLKQAHIPSNIERRQQALSCVAGECWNMLPAAEKQKWQAKAAEAYRVHQLKYPDYKFTPAPKGSGRKGKGKSEVSDSTVRSLREKYVHMPGPAVPPARRGRGRKAKGKLRKDDIRSDVETVSEPSLTPSLAPATVPAPIPLYPYAVAESSGESAALPPQFPSPSMPYYFSDRRQMSSGASPAMEVQPGTDSYFAQLPVRPMSVPIQPSTSSDMEFQGMGGFDMSSFSQEAHHYTENYEPYNINTAQPSVGDMNALRYTPPFSALTSGADDQQAYPSPVLHSEGEMLPSPLYSEEGTYPFCPEMGLVYPSDYPEYEN